MERSVTLRGGPADGQNVVIDLASSVLPSIIRVQVTGGVAQVRFTTDYTEIVTMDRDPSWSRYRRASYAATATDPDYQFDR